MIDIIGKLEIFAAANDLHFIYGTTHYASADRNGYANGERVLVCEFSSTLTFNPNSHNNAIMREQHNVLLMFGQKFDNDGRAASLDETMLQKYNRRLKLLYTDSVALVKSFACQNELYIRDLRIELVPNMFSDNIDFVKINANFEN